tara:strand:+ start:3681 stop:4490 length:810 start_codon:yes stop_codon:yes gene_type:complete
VLSVPIQNLVKDKRVIIVGNSVEMMKHEYGDFIDSFDIVVHLGAAITRGKKFYKHLGSRTDIWATGTFRFDCYWDCEEDFISGRYKDTMVLFNRARTKLLNVDAIAHFENQLPQIPRKDMFCDVELINLLDEFNYLDGFGDGYRGPKNGMRPSGGFITILYFIRKVQTYKSLDIIGFDFFRKTTDVYRKKPNDETKGAVPFSWYMPMRSATTGSHPHNKTLEFDYVKKLEKENKINWNVLTDLKDKVVKYDGWLEGSEQWNRGITKSDS